MDKYQPEDRREENLMRYMTNISYGHVGKKTLVCCITAYNGFEVIGHAPILDPSKEQAKEYTARELAETRAYNNALVPFDALITFLEADRNFVIDFDDIEDKCTCECRGDCNK